MKMRRFLRREDGETCLIYRKFSAGVHQLGSSVLSDARLMKAVLVARRPARNENFEDHA